MKKLILIVVMIMVLFTACGSSKPEAEDYDLSSKEGIQEYTEAYFKDNAHAKIDRVEVNDDAGTGSGFTLMIYLTYDRDDDPAVIGKQVKADSVAFTVDSNGALSDVNLLCLFWDIPQADTEAKYQYTRVSNGFKEDSVINPLA